MTDTELRHIAELAALRTLLGMLLAERASVETQPAEWLDDLLARALDLAPGADRAAANDVRRLVAEEMQRVVKTAKDRVTMAERLPWRFQ